MATKILALTDVLGNLVQLVLLPWQRFDTVGALPLDAGIRFGALLADNAFDSNPIIADLDQRGAKLSCHSIHAALSHCRLIQRCINAPSDRKFRWQTQRFQAHRDARLQD
jgi:hypothetical protein